MRNLMISTLQDISEQLDDDPLDWVNWNDFSNADLIAYHHQLVISMYHSMIGNANVDVNPDTY